MIEIMLIRGHWMARYTGEMKRDIEMLFQTDTLPTAFDQAVSKEIVVAELQKRNPGITVK